MNAEDSCRTCRFFRLTHDVEVNATGQCRRFSPIPVYIQSALLPRAQWPQVNADKDWCGQFKPVKSNLKRDT
jgi:hypothetical protein